MSSQTDQSVDPDQLDTDLDIDSDAPVRVLDLFCGGGGLTKAIADVVQESGRELEMVALNHDPRQSPPTEPITTNMQPNFASTPAA